MGINHSISIISHVSWGTEDFLLKIRVYGLPLSLTQRSQISQLCSSINCNLLELVRGHKEDYSRFVRVGIRELQIETPQYLSVCMQVVIN